VLADDRDMTIIDLAVGEMLGNWVASNFDFCFAFSRPSIVDAFEGDGLFAGVLATVGKQFVRDFPWANGIFEGSFFLGGEVVGIVCHGCFAFV
jgi:hypothetical protein